MKLTLLALRNLGRQKRRTFLLAGAIAFGILVVTVVNGAAGGLAQNLQRNFSQLLGGEIFVQGVEKTPGGQRIELIDANDDAALTAAVTGSEIRAQSVTRTSRFLGTFLFHNATAIQEVVGTDFGPGGRRPFAVGWRCSPAALTEWQTRGGSSSARRWPSD